jgi:diguanylate cyclase (GGDEF)-like protein
MFADDSPLILIQSIMTIVGTCALAWAILTAPLRIDWRVSTLLISANSLLFAAFWLLSQRSEAESPLLAMGPNLGVLASIVLFRIALQLMTRQTVKWREYLLVVPVVIGLAAIVSPLAGSVLPPIGSVPAMVTTFLLGSWVLLRCAREVAKALFEEFGILATTAITWPFAIAGVMLFGRVAIFLSLPQLFAEQINIYGVSSLFLWTCLTLLLAGNCSIVGILIARLITQIRVLAERDVLTGVWNRQAIEGHLESARARSRRYGEIFALVLFDLDHFKSVNDRLGHDGGDAALKHATLVVGDALRQLDIIGRFGGEEFLVLLPMTDLSGARGAAERMRQALVATPLIWQGQSIPISASFGVANTNGPAESADSLVQRADKALYFAKASGRNRVEVEDTAIP